MASASAGDPECPENPVTQKVKLVRHDLNAFGLKDKAIEKGIEVEMSSETSREDFIKDNMLPADSILKVKVNGNYIPWSLIPLCCADLVEVQVLRPRQNVKPHVNKFVENHDAVRQAVSALDTRITSLEEDAKPSVMEAKEVAEIEALCKQVDFLQRRMDEADKTEWLRDGDGPTTSSTVAAQEKESEASN